MLTRLLRLAARLGDAAVRGDDPHRYAPDRAWPLGCWCGHPRGAPQHRETVR